MKLAPYIEMQAHWPASGRHILASHDPDTIVVYQAYRPEIARHAVRYQRFGGEFSFGRMSWIKPNFLWMMYRSGWGTKEGQEVTLAITISRTLFDEILAVAVPSSFDSSRYHQTDDWKDALASSEVRLQWDPDHAPDGSPLQRRAVQLGLRGDTLRRYADREVIGIADTSEFVAEQREFQHDPNKLMVPAETIYQPRREDAVGNVGLDSWEAISLS